MKNKTRSIFVTILSALACVCMVFACVFGFGGKGKEVHADEDPITGTKYIISVDGNYLLLATAFKLEQIKEGSRYAFGYFVTKDGGTEEAHYSSKYWEGITLKTGDGTTDYSSADIFGEDYSFENGYVLIVEELDYVRGSSYDYQAFIWEENESPVLGTAYTGHQKFVVTIDYNDGSESVTRMVNNGAKLSIDEPEKDDYNFVGWKAQDGETLVDFDIENDTISADTTLVAQWKKRPVVTGLADSHEYMIDKYNDVGYTVLLNDYAANELVVKNGETTLTESDDYSYDSENNKLVLKANYLNKIYRFGTSSYDFDLNGSSFTVSYENPENRVLNGGFETGSIYGWNAYAIWKDESGMSAWAYNNRVVNYNYFMWDKDGAGYTYNRDGNYNIGIYKNINSNGKEQADKNEKDDAQERMGHLRSANFKIGGSGWISFKLGGGKYTQFAYVSVRRADDNTEVARFGNRHFNDTGVSGTDNAEAYLFPYYFNLYDIEGVEENDEFYFVISDTSSKDWCVLSADSFFTYYASAPLTAAEIEDGKKVAENILPVVPNVDSANTEFKSGSFGDGWSADWTISSPNNCFAVNDYGFMMSNQNNTGDGGIGILRSSAFIVSQDKPYLYLKWSGGLSKDKQEFISVKEVGSNIEVMRFVSGSTSDVNIHDGSDKYKEQTLDLSSFADGKKYYIEVCDNRTGGWGCIFVKDFEFVNTENSRKGTKVLWYNQTPYLPTSAYVNPY